MKRALALTAMLAGAAAMCGPALAAGTPQYGSVKLQWNVATTLTATIHTNYTAAFASNTGAPTLLSNPASTCGSPASETDLTLDYGTLTPSATATVACTFTNALGASYTTNDSSGVIVNQYFDAALPTGTNVCAFPNTGAAFPMTPAASITTSARTGVGPAVYTAGACGAGGAEVKQGTGGTLNNSGGGSTQVAAAPATGEYYSGATITNAQNWIKTTTSSASAVLAGEDLQINIGTTATSTTTPNTAIMTVQFIPQ